MFSVEYSIHRLIFLPKENHKNMKVNTINAYLILILFFQVVLFVMRFYFIYI